MTTAHVLEQLPFWIEGDLSTQACEAVQAHLDLCPSCRATAEDLRTSQAWLREALEPPFDATDREALRRAVMDQLRQAQRTAPARPLRLRPVLLAACAAALLVAGLARLLDRPVQTTQPLVTPSAAFAAAQATVPLAASPHPVQANQDRPVSSRTRPHPPQAAPGPFSASPTRIEFQLPDSNIRIVWLAQATPLPNPNDSSLEAL